MFGALTWIGFMVVVVGWGLLFSATPVIEILATLTGRNATSLTHLASIAECTIFTGLGLAIVGALQTGFGALNHFFGAVLDRTARPTAKLEPEEPRIKLPAKELNKAVPLKRDPPVRKQSKIVERGRLKNRAYVLFGDGSVEVETLLGLRHFASLGEANEFIG